MKLKKEIFRNAAVVCPEAFRDIVNFYGIAYRAEATMLRLNSGKKSFKDVDKERSVDEELEKFVWATDMLRKSFFKMNDSYKESTGRYLLPKMPRNHETSEKMYNWLKAAV